MMDASYVTMLDSCFDYFYVQEIISVMNDVFRRKCEGCKNAALSQLDHECLTKSTKDQLELYWEYILRQINEIRVIEKWYGTVYTMNTIPIEVIDLYKLKLDCQDWRDTDMKTDSWKKRLIKLTLAVLRLEKRFS